MDDNEIINEASKNYEKYRLKINEAKSQNKDKKELLILVNNILKKHNITEKIDETQIEFTPSFVGNLFLKDKKLSHLIFDKYFPKPELRSYYHFTSFSATANIIATQCLRLSNLRKRFREDEYFKFYSDHGIDGYKKGGIFLGVDYSEKKIMSKIFFLSLTGLDSDHDNETKWTDFGENGKGIRIEFEINPKHNDFREVYYSLYKNQNCLQLIKDLSIGIKTKFGKIFNFTYISKIGAFYIKGDFNNEKEYRFLIKLDSDDYEASDIKPNITNRKENIGYIEIPLLNKFGDFKIKSIQPGYNCSNDNISKMKNIIAINDPNIKLLGKANR